MTKSMGIAAACAVAALIGGQAATAQPEGAAARIASQGQCFSTTQIQHWRVANPRQINVRTNGGRIFQINLADDCNGLVWSDNTPVIAPADGGSRICSATDLSTIKVLSNGMAEHCIVQSVNQLRPDEIAALSRKAMP